MDGSKEKNIRKKDNEETFKLKISENNLTRYHFDKEKTESTSENEDADKFEE